MEVKQDRVEFLEERVKKAYQSLYKDYEYYKSVVLEQISKDKLNERMQGKYEYTQKALTTMKFYFNDLIEENKVENEEAF